MDKNIKLNDDGTVSPIDPAKPSRYTTEPTIEAILDKLWKDAWGKLGAYDFDGTGVDTLTKDQAKEAIERIISDQVAKARIDERSQAQQYLHGLTITPENQHLFDVLSRNNHNRIATINGVKK